MADALTAFTDLLNKPEAAWGGRLVAGAALAGIVWKFFDKVEAVLTDQTKFEIAVWLVGVKLGEKVEPWPETFGKVFDRVFGTKHLSWKCLRRSAIVSLIISALAWALLLWHESFLPFSKREITVYFICTIVGNALPDYFSLLKTRWCIGALQKIRSATLAFLLVIADFIVTCAFAVITTLSLLTALYGDIQFTENPPEHSSEIFHWFIQSMYSGLSPSNYINLIATSFSHVNFGIVYLYPPFFTFVWTLLYAGSGFLLKFARRFDLGFDWFNRKFDIEKKPLSAIGLVAGSLVAMLYWTWVVFRHFVPA